MKILVTGFEPFGVLSKNPSWEAVKKIKERNEVTIVKKLLPVEYEKSKEVLFEILKEENPHIVILTGVAQSRPDITVEKVAINLRDASIPDNSGTLLKDVPIISNGENAYFSSLPVREIVDELNKNNIKASISYSAGTYVCNNVFYSLMNYINQEKRNVIGGFIHLPDDYSDNMVKAIELAIDISIKKVNG